MEDLTRNTEVQELKRDLLSLDSKDENTRIDLNKRLIKRYPFLEIKGWNASEHSDFSSTLLDCMPVGWRNTLGIPLCEELREELIRIDPSLLNKYRVSQVKEKYGSLRWYADSYSDQMEDIPEVIVAKQVSYPNKPKAKILFFDNIFRYIRSRFDEALGRKAVSNL